MYDAAVQKLSSAQIDALFDPSCLTVGRALPGQDTLAKTNLAVFNQSSDGSIGVRWRSRDAYLLSVAAPAVAGYEFLENFIERPENRLVVKLKPGQVIVLDNTALLHGRLPFPSTERRRNIRVNYYSNGTLNSKLVQGFALRPEAVAANEEDA